MKIKESMRNFIYHDKPKELCYGCRACEQICPHKAIRMRSDEEGFIYPIIDCAICVDCGLCEAVCPTQDSNRDKVLHAVPAICYAAWNKNLQERMQSTSGGMFFLLARGFINKGGVVYGVAMDQELMAKHVRTATEEQLQALLGSKYMQSDTGDTFSRVKADLKAGMQVLYSGTPCQVAGLRSYLMKDYDNLYTVDLVCHGTPSPMIFREHVNYLEAQDHSKIVSYSFRYKRKTGWTPYISYQLENGKRKVRMLGEDFYAQCFYASYLHRKSCYLCEYSQSKRAGDVTLSDFWGSELSSKRLKRARKFGYNMVMCNTKKGLQLLEGVKDETEMIACDIAVAIKGDIRLREAEKEPALRQRIYTDFRANGYGYIANHYSRKMPLKNRFVPQILKLAIKELKSYC